MKKKLLTILLCIVLTLFISGCDKKEKDIEINYDSDVTLSINEDTLTDEKATLALQNNGEETYYYDGSFWIERKEKNEWNKLKATNETEDIKPLYDLKPSEVNTFELNWNDVYGKLQSGDYRIVKGITNKEDKDFFIAVDFKIDSD